MALGRLELETGNLSSAEGEARQAAEEFRKAKDPDSQASAEVLLTRTLLAQHKTEEALSAAGDATKLAAQGGSRATQIEVASLQAEVQMRSGKPSEADRSLRRVVADCRKAGLVALEFEARLVQGEAEITTGNRTHGRALLATVAHDAQVKGFLLIARKAAAATKAH